MKTTYKSIDDDIGFRPVNDDIGFRPIDDDIGFKAVEDITDAYLSGLKPITIAERSVHAKPTEQEYEQAGYGSGPTKTFGELKNEIQNWVRHNIPTPSDFGLVQDAIKSGEFGRSSVYGPADGFRETAARFQYFADYLGSLGGNVNPKAINSLNLGYQLFKHLSGWEIGAEGWTKEDLERRAEEFTGWGSIVMPPTAEGVKTALEIKFLMPFLFKSGTLLSKAAHKIPVVKQASQFLSKIGGVDAVRRKYPAVYNRVKHLADQLEAGYFAGVLRGLIEVPGKDMDMSEIVEHVNQRGKEWATISGVFGLASTIDKHQYLKKYGEHLRRGTEAKIDKYIADKMAERYKAFQSLNKSWMRKIAKASPAEKAHLQKNHSDWIDQQKQNFMEMEIALRRGYVRTAVSAVENNIIQKEQELFGTGRSRGLFGGEQPKDDAATAAQKFLDSPAWSPTGKSAVDKLTSGQQPAKGDRYQTPQQKKALATKKEAEQNFDTKQKIADSLAENFAALKSSLPKAVQDKVDSVVRGFKNAQANYRTKQAQKSGDARAQYEKNIKDIYSLQDELRNHSDPAVRAIARNLQYHHLETPAAREAVKSAVRTVEQTRIDQVNALERDRLLRIKQIKAFVERTQSRAKQASDGLAPKLPVEPKTSTPLQLSGTEKASDAVRNVIKSDGRKDSKVDHVVDLKEEKIQTRRVGTDGVFYGTGIKSDSAVSVTLPKSGKNIVTIAGTSGHEGGAGAAPVADAFDDGYIKPVQEVLDIISTGTSADPTLSSDLAGLISLKMQGIEIAHFPDSDNPDQIVSVDLRKFDTIKALNELREFYPPTFEPTEKDIIADDSLNRHLFSRVRQTLENKMSNKMSSVEAAKMLINAGLSSEEIQYSGIMKVLDDNEFVTKEQLLQAYDENDYVLSNVILTEGDAYFYEWTSAYRASEGLSDQVKNNYREILITTSHTRAGRHNDHFTRAQQHTDKISFLNSIIAHYRVYDIVNKDGVRTLMIDEIQSDVHQKGRKEGYHGTPEVANIRQEKYERLLMVEHQLEDALAKKNGGLHNVLPKDEWYDDYLISEGMSAALIDEWLTLKEYFYTNSTKHSPDFPYKKNWELLAIKDILRRAVAEGYDSVAFATGQLQTARYGNRNLESFYDKILPKKINAYLKQYGTQTAQVPHKLPGFEGKINLETITITPRLKEALSKDKAQPRYERPASNLDQQSESLFTNDLAEPPIEKMHSNLSPIQKSSPLSLVQFINTSVPMTAEEQSFYDQLSKDGLDYLYAKYHGNLLGLPAHVRGMGLREVTDLQGFTPELQTAIAKRLHLAPFETRSAALSELEQLEGPAIVTPANTMKYQEALAAADSEIAALKGAPIKDIFGVLLKHKLIGSQEYALFNAIADAFPKEVLNTAFLRLKMDDIYFDYINGAHSLTGGIYASTLAKDYLAGARDIITLFRSRSPKTFAHELGHRVLFRFLTNEEFAEAYQIYTRSPAYQAFEAAKQSGDTHKKYRNSFGEWFAESVAMHVNNLLKQTDKLNSIFGKAVARLKGLYDKIKRFLHQEPEMEKFLNKIFSDKNRQQISKQDMILRDTLRRQTAAVATNFDMTQSRSDLFTSFDRVLDNSDPASLYPRLTYNDLIKRVEAGDLLAQKELDARISAAEPEPKISTERKNLLKDAHIKERAIAGLSINDKKELKKMLFGSDSMTFFTDDQIKSYIKELDHLKVFFEDPRNESDVLATELGMSAEQLNTLSKYAKNDYRVVNNVLKNRLKNGGYTWKDKAIAARQLRRDQRMAENVVKDREKSLQSQRQKGLSHNRINDLQSSRYVFSNLQSATGLPYYDTAENIEDVSITARNTAGKIVADELAKPGTRTGKVFGSWFLASHNVQTPLINEALNTADDEKRAQLIAQMTPAQQDLYDKMYNLLKEDGAAACAIREIRWWEWNNALLEAEQAPNEGIRKILLQKANNLMPPDLAGKKQQAEKDRIIKEGREALAQGKDSFKAWIAKERFGTRQFYFMSAPTNGSLITGPVSLELNTQIAQHSSGVTGDLREAHTRHGQAETSHRPILQSVIMHIHRAIFANDVKEFKHQFNALLNQTDLNQNDREMIQTWYDNMAGVGQGAGIMTWFAEKANNFVWRTFPLQITKAAHYTARNLLQNTLLIANLPSHEIMRSAVKLAIGKRSQELVNTVREKWGLITQKKGLREHVMQLKESAELGNASYADNLLHTFNQQLGNIGGAIITMSDEVNRKIAFPVMFESGLRNAKEYLSGKRSFDSLRSNLMLDNLDEAQIDKLERILTGAAGGDPPKDFAYWYARYKTENMHYKYNREARGMMEQTRGGRVVFGLANWVRGIWQQVIRNGTQVATRGIRDKDLRTLIQGIMTVTGVYVAIRLANEALRAIAGERYYQGYDLIQTFFGINPGSWGANQIFETYEDITGIISEVMDGTEWDEEKIDKVMDRVSRDMIDWWFPLVDTFIAYSEVENDTSGLSFWKAMRLALDDKYAGINSGKKHDYDRDSLQIMQRMVFGGEKSPKHLRKDWDDYSDYEKFMRIAVGKTAEYDVDPTRRGR